MKRKLKILMLGYDDNHLAGHVYSAFNNVPESYDKRLVVFRTLHKDYRRSFFEGSSLIGKTLVRLINLLFVLKRSFFTKTISKIDVNKSYYSFYGNEFTPITAKQILNKNKDFIPDIISIHWAAGFISTRIVRDLYKKTGAKIVYVFVDQQHMTGGCHYPVDCLNYLTGCHDCPSLKKGKRTAAIQMQMKISNLKNIPLIVYASPYDCRIAQKTPLFKKAKFFSNIRIPELPVYSKIDARRSFNVHDDEFLIMLGAHNLGEVRKGLIYSIEAIKLFSRNHDKICVLVPGHQDGNAIDFGNVKVISPGFLDKNKLCAAYCAADCFLSTTIADSGPMMVNFSISVGTPVVSFDVGIAQDIVIHKETGYISKYKDIDDLSLGLEYIYTRGKEYFKEGCMNIALKYKDQPSFWNQLYDYMLLG